MLNPFLRFAISAACRQLTPITMRQPSWRLLSIQDRSVRLQHLVDGGGHAVVIVVQCYRPSALFQVVTGVSHDDRMSGEGQHLDVIVIVTDGHDLAAVDSAMPGPALQRVSLRTA